MVSDVPLKNAHNSRRNCFSLRSCARRQWKAVRSEIAHTNLSRRDNSAERHLHSEPIRGGALVGAQNCDGRRCVECAELVPRERCENRCTLIDEYPRRRTFDRILESSGWYRPRCNYIDAFKLIISFGTGEHSVKHKMSMPLIGNGIVFTGVGDLFAALFLAHSATQPSLKDAFEHTIATLQAVLKNTVQFIPLGEKNFLSPVIFVCILSFSLQKILPRKM